MPKTENKKRRYWLSYDLGFRGNYEELYEWLDTFEAKECGESVATFMTDMTLEQIKDSLAKILNQGARIYLIWKMNGRVMGRFLFGRRKKNPPWFGHAELDDEEEIGESD